MNVVLLSPHFPPNYYQFAVGLAHTGVNAFGIGDAPFATLRPELREALTEYYQVSNLHHYDQVMRACAYFVHRHGRIDWLESHNEHWLETDARLRTDFNIPGPKQADAQAVKRKSAMKRQFIAADVDVAPGRLVATREDADALIAEIGYPVIAKPDIGVGATATYKIDDDAALARFFAQKPSVDYLMEAFITGQLQSFDGLVDQHGRVVFSTGHFYEPGIMDVVNYDLDVYACSFRELPPGLVQAGMRVVRAFDLRGRFFHVEFFRVGDRWIIIEANMRPPGGVMMDVFNFANDINLYQEWANVVAFNAFSSEYTRPYHCAFVGRKRHRPHKRSHYDIIQTYGPILVHHEPTNPVFARAMGDYAYLVRSPKLDEVRQAIAYILAV